MAIVTISDFSSGEYVMNIQGNKFVQTAIAIIAKQEAVILQNTFGKDLYDLFVINQTASTPDQRLTDLNNPVTVDYCNVKYSNFGLKDALLPIIYYSIVQKQMSMNSSAGDSSYSSETGANETSILHARYNEGINNLKIIQRYIMDNIDNYPEFSYRELRYVSPL